MRIKFFSRSFDKRLYIQSKKLYEDAGYPCVRLTDQTADGYFYTMLADTDCDIAINVDEDCFISDLDAVLKLVDFAVEGGYANVGCSDGGAAVPRGGNPLVTNPFFNIFNLKLIREKFSKEAVRSFDYKVHRTEMEASYPKERLVYSYSFDSTCQEPYYQFMLWLAANFKTYYLPSDKHADGFTTILKMPENMDPKQNGYENKAFCLHTWLARFYTTPSWAVKYWMKDQGMQKQRIDDRIAEAYSTRGMTVIRFGTLQQLDCLMDRTMRWMVKIPQRIANWPNKLKMKINNKKK